MSVTDVTKDTDKLTMTITAEFDAPVAQVWKVWEDPRKLERWWGPPTYPATFVDHDFEPGGAVFYFMTSPEGDKSHGWWRFTSIDAPHRLEFQFGFADDSGQPNPNAPAATARVTLVDRDGGGTRMAVETTFPSAEVMQEMLTMGMDEGMSAAMGQIDALLP